MPGDYSTYRDQPGSDTGEEIADTEFMLQDHQDLVKMLKDERNKRVEAELKRKEAEDDRYAMERAQQEPGDRYVPVAITPDLLARTISESMRQAGRGGAHHRYHIRMPTPGCTGAPETFTGTSGKLLPEFFRRFELNLAEAEIDDEGEMLNHLLKYVGVTVGEWIQNQASFKRGRYEELKSELLTLYGNPEKGDPYTVKDLTVLAMDYARTEVTTQDALSERLMVFDTMASKLITSKKLNEVDRDQLFFKTFTTARREAIWEHLSKTEPWHPRKEPFSMRQVCKAAKYLIEGRFDDEIEGDPRPTGQRLLDELKRVKEGKGNEPEKKEEDLYEVIRKMKKLSIQDPVYETHYTYLCRFYPEAAAIMLKPAALSPPPTNTTYGSREYRAPGGTMERQEWRSDWPRDKCFYCAENGCSMSRCVALTTDIKDGLVRKDGQSLTYKDGGRLFRKDNGIRQDVLARRAREVAERNASNARETKDVPPHQANVYQLYEGDEEEFRGFYIGIQEVPKGEEEVNAYTVDDEEEEETVALAESYYSEMVNEGYNDEDATQRAWVMATTRQEGKARAARESAKPYDREKSKGKERAVHFEKETTSSTNYRAKPRSPPAPVTRFPPSAPMPLQPVTVQKPSANDWPRPPTPKPLMATANPAVATTHTPPVPRPIQPYPAHDKQVTIPEIDMTGKPVPKYRFTSEIEERVDTEKTMDAILSNVKISVNLVDLLALSPAMRKHLAEMTKTKRVPTTDVAKPKKALIVEELRDEGGTFMSMPVIEASTRSPRYSGALPRIQADINGTPAVGMMDTGSQINLMTEEFWTKTGLPINEGRRIRMQGVNLTGDQSMGLCEHVEVPFGGVMTRAHFHVFKKGPYPFILGQPWIQDHLIAITETGHTNKILIRDFRDPTSRVTMILRNDVENESRGDLPTIVEMSMPPLAEVSAYIGIVEDCVVEPEVFEELEESLAMEDEREIQRIDALTGKTEEHSASFRRPL
jgi:gag-polyprotein putative aspartyl protease